MVPDSIPWYVNSRRLMGGEGRRLVNAAKPRRGHTNAYLIPRSYTSAVNTRATAHKLVLNLNETVSLKD